MRKAHNHIQVTIKDHAFIFDLNGESPVLVADLDKMNELYDP